MIRTIADINAAQRRAWNQDGAGVYWLVTFKPSGVTRTVEAATREEAMRKADNARSAEKSGESVASVRAGERYMYVGWGK